MQRRWVNSAVIQTIGYDPQTSILEVEFRTGRIYQYSAVTPALYEQLLGADSIGEYFNRWIRPSHPYVEVTNKL